MMLEKVVSGGQTGVDRAGLDAAGAAGIATGGYCPKGRRAEDGTIPEKYLLQEIDAPEYQVRTEKNVVESDGTLILNKGCLSEGTKLTYDYTVSHRKPCLIVQLDGDAGVEPAQVAGWVRGERIAVLNVAGPRESKCSSGIYEEALSFLARVFALLKG
jgi:hypothetical protein